MTSNEFSNLNVPGTAYKLTFYDKPISGNYNLALSKEEPSKKDPAGQRMPKAAETGLGEELPKIAVQMREEGRTDDEIVE